MNRWRSSVRCSLVGVAVAVAVVAVVIAGCGSSTPKSVMDAAVQGKLRIDTQAVASAAASHNVPQLELAIAALNADAVAAHNAGKLTDTKLAEIGRAIAAVQSVLNVSSSVSRTPTAKPTPTPTPKPPPAHKKKGGDGHGGGGEGGGG